MQRIILGIAAYVVATFVWAVVWHIALFEALYRRIGYFGDQEPIFLLGFLAILIQGILLNLAYAQVRNRAGERIGPLRFSLACGAFLHSTHVIAYAAKQPVDLIPFAAMETFYLAIQFIVFAAILRLLYPRSG